MLQNKRATRGLRMSALVDEAVEQDETFWNNEVWVEDESDDSFSEEEIKPDVFDSDFNDTEDEGEGSSDEEPSKTREAEKVSLAFFSYFQQIILMIVWNVAWKGKQI